MRKLAPAACFVLEMTLLATVGFGLAGLLQNILVRPISMYFPGNLVYVTIFNTLGTVDKTGLTEKRLKFFAIVFGVTFIYQVC